MKQLVVTEILVNILEETEIQEEGVLDKKHQLFASRVFTSEPTGKNLGT